MLIGGKEYKTGQRIKVINAKSILHYKYGMTGDCNKDMTGIMGVITAESTYGIRKGKFESRRAIQRTLQKWNDKAIL